jgi:uncharacterized phiE125 gp8 family phage protein
MRKLITAPTTEPITTAEAKIYLKVDDSTEDALIAVLIKAVRMAAEKYMGRALITQTWEASFDEFPDCDEDWTFELYTCPVSKINTLKYYDASDVLATLATTVYLPDYVSEPCRVGLAYGQSWPSISGRQNSVVINYECGYGAASVVPDLIKAGMYLHLGHLYENRQDVTKEKMNELPMGSRSLYDMYRVY